MNHPPENLVLEAIRLGYEVRVVPGVIRYDNQVLGSVAHVATIHPVERLIQVSGSFEPDFVAELMAHELGHASQFEDGSYYVGDDICRYFSCEMDAVRRGEKFLGRPMPRNFWDNYLGYGADLGLEHMGRS